MNELSEPVKNLILKYAAPEKQSSTNKATPTIHVDEVALKVAAFYEQIRTIVDWKEEHLMRRAAIIRKLKRRFFDLELNNYSGQDEIAEALVLELIRGGHFSNDTIEESKILDIQKIISKYVFIIKNSPENKKGKAGINFYNWLLEIAACEIEDALAPSIKEIALIDFMFGLMKEKIKVADKKEDTNIQIYIAVQQSLFKLDKPIISYNIIKYKYPQWRSADDKFLLKTSQNAYDIWQEIEEDFTNPLANKFYVICEKYDTPYLLLGDILSENNPKEITQQIIDPPTLEMLIRKTYLKRLSGLKARISRAAIYSTISIFITKVLSLVLLEILLSEILLGQLNPIALVADVLIPTLLMFTIVSLIKKPSKENLNIVVMETMKIVYKKESAEVYEIKTPKKKGIISRIIISLVYTLSSFISFGAIYFILNYFNFPLIDIIVNIIFIALILFAGTAVAKRAQELTMEDEKEGFLSFLSDVFFLPMQGLGKWLSTKWKKYNAIAAFFNALIDMPFSVFVEFIEKWRYFIKERKEEIR
jgi:hypothetical protein